jgi:DNA-binding XRE family transcriptional regulator
MAFSKTVGRYSAGAGYHEHRNLTRAHTLPSEVSRIPSSQGRQMLAALLRGLRTNAGATPGEVVAALGITKGHLSNIETGRDLPSWKVAAYYEDQFSGDGSVWTAYVAAVLGSRAPQRSEASQRPAYPIPGDAAEFIADVTIPDGMILPPASTATKTWRIRNAGEVPWIGRRLARRGPAAGDSILASSTFVEVPHTRPGDTVDISVEITTPPLQCTTVAYWKMVDENGYEYFPDRYPHGVMTLIVVRR